MLKIKICFFLLFALFVFTNNAFASNPDSSFIYKIEIANRYLWRGDIYNSSPIIRGFAGYQWKKLNAYFIGTYSVDPDQYHELNLGLEYKFAEGLTAGIVDYYGFVDSLNVTQEFSRLKETSTKHTLDAYLIYETQTKVPVTFAWSTFVYGVDLNEKQKNMYSSYFEVQPTFTKGSYSIVPFLGLSPFKGYYSDKAAIINTGLKVGRSFKINPNVSLPTEIGFIVNPYLDKAFVCITIGIE